MRPRAAGSIAIGLNATTVDGKLGRLCRRGRDRQQRQGCGSARSPSGWTAARPPAIRSRSAKARSPTWPTPCRSASAGSERKIVNVAPGTLSATSTDAVNGSQLFNTNSNVTNLQTQINNGSIGLVQQAGPGQPITVGASTDGTVVNFTGTGGTRVLTGVSAGALTSSSTDAVNGSQLFTANERVAAAFGTTLDGNGQLVAPSYTIQGSVFNNVGGAFNAVDSALTTNKNSISNLQNQINNGSIGLVQQDAGTKVITVGANTNGKVVNFAGTAGDRLLTGVSAGVLSANSTDAVNGSQLFATNQQVAANTSAIGTLTGQVATNTADIATLNSTVAGISSAGQYVKVNSTGAPANASGANAIAIGSGAQSTQSGSIAMGLNSSSTGTNSIAIGTGASATGSVAIGAQASASNGGAAYGDGASATGTNPPRSARAAPPPRRTPFRSAPARSQTFRTLSRSAHRATSGASPTSQRASPRPTRSTLASFRASRPALVRKSSGCSSSSTRLTGSCAMVSRSPWRAAACPPYQPDARWVCSATSPDTTATAPPVSASRACCMTPKPIRFRPTALLASVLTQGSWADVGVSPSSGKIADRKIEGGS